MKKDFVVTVFLTVSCYSARASEGKIVCIMDAKCKTASTLETKDFQRLLSYILDLVYPTQEKLTAVIFLISRGNKIRRLTARNCDIYLIPMLPTSYNQVRSEILPIVESALTAG